MQRGLVAFFIAGLLIVGCTSTSNPTPLPVSDLPTAPPIVASVTPRKIPPTETNIPPTFHPPYTPTPFLVNSIAEFPGNLANGEAAPDFFANLTGGGTYSLAAPRNGYLLLFPTVAGCGDCMFGLSQIDIGLTQFPNIDLQVLVLSVVVSDDPEIWQYYKEIVTNPKIQWGVISSESFVLDYKVLTLGPILLIDPSGDIVYRNNHPLPAWQLEKLFALTSR